MIQRFLLIIALLFFASTLNAQQQGKNKKKIARPAKKEYAEDNEYRSAKNQYYWKNRRPDKDYWQQDVHYIIDAAIDEKANLINGHEQLNYWNNSPDTLRYVYFHLYQNAFVKGSHLHNLEKANKVKAKLGKYEAAGLGIVVDSIMVDNEAVQTELDNTIMKVYLPKPLLPGGKITFSIQFDTYYDRGQHPAAHADVGLMGLYTLQRHAMVPENICL